MFNLFNRKTVKETMEEAKETYPSTAPEVKPPRDECLYTVGITPLGQTVLKVGDGYNGVITTLTMNEIAVRQMIRLLEATISESENERPCN